MLGSILNSSPKPGECYNLKGTKKTQLSYLKIKKQSPLLHLVMFEILLIEMNSFAFSSWLQRCLRCHILKIVLDIHILLWKSVFQKDSCEYIVWIKRWYGGSCSEISEKGRKNTGTKSVQPWEQQNTRSTQLHPEKSPSS